MEKSPALSPENDPEEINLVALWLRRDPARWVAGIAAGIFAGLVAMALAMVMSVILGYEAWFPIKLMATIVLGPYATVYGMNVGPIVVGLVLFEAVTAFFGFVYAHFVATNNLKALAAMGLVWGIYSWIFLWDLFMQSFKTIYHSGVPHSAAFPVCLAYGLSLTSVAFFDRALRGGHPQR